MRAPAWNRTSFIADLTIPLALLGRADEVID
jgi:hypothetical protein